MTGPGDRRQGGRTAVTAGRAVTASAGGTAIGSVVDLGSRTASVRLPAGVDAPASGSGYEGISFTTGDHETPIGDAHVVQSRRSGGRSTIVLEFSGTGAAHLWDFRDRYRNPDLRVRDAAPDTSRARRIPGRGHYTEASRHDRLDWLRSVVDDPLTSLGEVAFDSERLTGNIENLVGGVMVPVGLAGPLRFRGGHARGDLYAPFATTEGCLVASACRGAQALTRAGGVTTQVVSQVMTRAPAFTFRDIHAASTFCRWIEDHVDDIRAEAALVSSHADLVELEPILVGRIVHVRFCFETGDAAGQNMTTVCTWRAARWIVRQLAHHPDLAVEHFIVEANVSGDKKLNHMSFVRGRGTRVVAEAYVPADVLWEVLKVTTEQLRSAHQAFLGGTFQTGSVGFDINVANAVAAIFTATGQDIACAHESSVGILGLDADVDGVYLSHLLPGLIVGTVGGGTHLPNQRDALAIMGCDGPGKAFRLAEIIAGFALALDLSTLAAIASGQFVAAHEKLGRSRPVEWFTRSDLTPAFFESCLRVATEDPGLVVTSAEPIKAEMEASILAELTGHRVKHLTGLHPYRLGMRCGPDAADRELDVVTKIKPLDDEVMLMIRSMAVACGEAVSSAYEAAEDRLPFRGSHLRELDLYTTPDPRFARHAPKPYVNFRDDEREAYVLGLELLGPDAVLLNSIGDVSAWTGDDIDTALRGISEVHAVWLGRDSDILETGRFGPHLTSVDMADMAPLWLSLGAYARDEFPELFTESDLDRLTDWVATIDKWWLELEAMERTLIHNDFNPRNVCLRTNSDGTRLCAYDWELACWHVPQRDTAELLVFVLDGRVERETVGHHVDVARRALEAATGRSLDPAEWRRGFDLSLRDFFVNRFLLYLMSHSFRDHRFLEHVAPTLRAMLDLAETQP